ncbi:MAG: molybdenum cofactor guanylyltransferase [Vicinamibacterales bacterium]
MHTAGDAWTVALLAGGRARRLGGSLKSDLLVGSRSIVERQLAAVADAGLRACLVTRDDDRDAHAHRGLPLLVDAIADVGPLGGLLAALDATRAERIVLMASDMPFVTGPFLRYLADRARASITLPATADGVHPLCAVYARSCAPVVRDLVARGLRAMRDLAAEVDVDVVSPQAVAQFDRAGMLLFNVNTPEDHARAHAHALAEDRMLAHAPEVVKHV